jgi:hypothetical protein
MNLSYVLLLASLPPQAPPVRACPPQAPLVRGPIPFAGCGCGYAKCPCEGGLGDRACPQGAWVMNPDGTYHKACACGCGARGSCCVKQGGYGRPVERPVVLPPIRRRPVDLNPMRSLLFSLRKESAMELKDRDLESVSAGKRRAPVAPPRPAPAPRPPVYLTLPPAAGVAPQGFGGSPPGMPFAGMGGGGGGCPGGVCPR